LYSLEEEFVLGYQYQRENEKQGITLEIKDIHEKWRFFALASGW